MSSISMFLIFGYICKWCSLGFFITSQVNKTWFISEAVEIGLYEYCAGSRCYPLSWNAEANLTPFVTRVMLIVAAVFIVGGIIAHIGAWFVSCEKRRKYYIGEGSLDIAAGMITGIAVITYTVLSTTSAIFNVYTTWNFGWAYNLCWISACLRVAAGVLEILAGAAQTTPMKQDGVPLQSQTPSNDYQSTHTPQAQDGGHHNATYQSFPSPEAPPLYQPTSQTNDSVNEKEPLAN